MKLMRVKKGYTLHYPMRFVQNENKEHVRGREGYVVDLDGPFETTLCEGQHGKLEPVPEADMKDGSPKPGEITNPKVLHLMRQAEAEARKRAESETRSKSASTDSSAAAPPPPGMPAIEKPPERVEPAKKVKAGAGA